MRAALDLEGRHATHEGLRVLARLQVGRRHCTQAPTLPGSSCNAPQAISECTSTLNPNWLTSVLHLGFETAPHPVRCSSK